MNRLKWYITTLFLCAAACSVFTAEDASDLLFDVTFDQYQVRADKAGGNPDTLSFPSPDLQLRMWKGVKNNKNAVTLSGSEVLDYGMKGNFDPRQGTVSLWVSPVNWKPSEPVFQRFFTATQPGFVFMIYKYLVPGQLLFYIQFRDQNKKQHVYTASAIIQDRDWTANKWHKLDVTWDSKGMKLYIDGVQPKVVTGRSPHSIPTTVFKTPLTFPDASAKGRIFLSEKVANGKYFKRESITAFDELKIYNRPLTAEEIKKKTELIVPSRFGEKQEKPMINIPRSTAAIVHDGNVDPAEWRDAVMVPIRKPFELNASNRSSFNCAYLKRNDNHLLIGLKSSRKAFLTKEKKHDGHVYSDDNFELHLVSPGGKKYQFVVNAAGVVFDSLNRKKNWNSGAVCKAASNAGSWSAELMIPLQSLDRISASGEWTGNFHKGEFENGFHGYSWSRTTGSFLNESCFGKIRFMDDVPGIQVCGYETLESGMMDLKSVFASSAAAKELTFKVFYEQENGVRSDFAENLAKSPWKTALPAGNIRINVTASKNKQNVYAYEDFLYIRHPLEMTYKALPLKNKIELAFDLSNLPAELRKKLPGGVTIQILLKGKNEKILEKKTITLTKTYDTVDLPMPQNITTGKYAICANITGTSMKKECFFHVPDMTPFRKKVGVDHSVPAPWGPIRKTGDKEFEMWGRKYIFGNSPFPVQMISQGKKMLKSSPELTLEGQPVVWSDFSVRKQYADVIFLTGKGTASGLQFQWTGELWFDGMYKVTWSMRSSREKTPLKSLDLSYQIPAEFGRYVFKMGREGIERWKNDQIEWEFDIRKSPHTQMTWTSGVKEGLIFWRLSDANWANPAGKKNLILRRSGEKINVLAKIISKPVELTGKAEYTMIFQATPTRALDGAYRSDNLGLARDDFVTMRLWDEGGGYAFGEKLIPKVWTTPASHVPRFPEKYWKLCKETKPAEHKTKPAMCRLAYTLMANLGSSEQEYDYFFESWATKPYSIWGYKFNGESHKLYRCCGSGIADLMMYRTEKLFQGDPNWIGGIYNDCGSAGGYCENPEHGCGGIDVFGKSFSSSLALSIREYCLRQYKLTQKYNKRLMHHVSDTFVPFAHAFCDDILPGETFMWPLSRNPEHFYCENVSPEFYQTVLNPDILRVGIQLLPQLFRACEFSPDMKRRLKEFQSDPAFTYSMMTPVLLHDFNTSTYYAMAKPIVKWWGIKERLKLSKAKFHGYWYDTAFRSPAKNVYISWYELSADSPYKRLIVVGNMSRKTQKIQLSADWKKAGLTGDKIRYFDLWNKDTELSENKLKELQLRGGHFLLLGIR